MTLLVIQEFEGQLVADGVELPLKDQVSGLERLLGLALNMDAKMIVMAHAFLDQVDLTIVTCVLVTLRLDDCNVINFEGCKEITNGAEYSHQVFASG